MVPAQLAREVEELRIDGCSVEATEADGWANVVFNDYPVPLGYNTPSTDLLLKLPLSYPNGSPDMFWTEEDLTLEGARIPNRAEHIEEALGRQWRRFSWHPQGWNPGRDSLRTYLEFVNHRLAKAE